MQIVTRRRLTHTPLSISTAIFPRVLWNRSFSVIMVVIGAPKFEELI